MGGDRYCGFCGKHETEVARLIAGPIANICNECVELQHGMLNETPSRKRSLHEVLSRARQRRIAELEAENRRMREALEKIAAPTFGTELWNTHKERAEIYWTHLTNFQTIARTALSQEDRDGTGNEQ